MNNICNRDTEDRLFIILRRLRIGYTGQSLIKREGKARSMKCDNTKNEKS